MTRHTGPLLLLVTVLASSAAAQPPSTGIVRGRVIAADTDAPVRKVRVALTPEGATATEPIYTNADGEFEFMSVAPGRYTLAALKTGYVIARFGARTQFDRTTSIAVAAGAVIENLELRIVKGAAITGRIVDAEGELIVGALVSVGRVVRTDSRMRFRSVGSLADTDDLGEYRIAGLAAGSYMVAVAAAGGGMAPRTERLFYPGTASLSQARAIPVRAGEVASATDLAVLPSQGKSDRLVSGYVTDATGAPVPAKLQVVANGDGVVVSGTTSTRQLPPNGEFAVRAESGDLTLIAQSATGIAVAHLPAGSDVAGLQLVLAKGGRVAGRVLFNGAPPPRGTAVNVEGWSADLEDVRPSSFMPRPTGSRPVNADGTFAIDDLVGRRELRVSSVPRGWTVAAITHDGRNLLNVPIEFKGGENLSGVRILLTDTPTELSGVVLDREQRPRSDCSVLVFAEDRTLLPGRARWVRPDQTGRFVVEGLPAGTYLAAAVADVDDVEWSTVEYLDRLRSSATRVAIADAEKKTFTLEWTP
jgi:hypothetical protein